MELALFDLELQQTFVINKIFLCLQVSSPFGHSYHIGEDVESGNFAFTAAEDGAYTSCFWAVNHQPPVKITIDFVWRTGIAAKDWSQVAKKGQVDVSFFYHIVRYF